MNDANFRHLLPQGWPRPKGYSNGIAAKGTVIVTGGLIGWNEKEEFEAKDFVGQAKQTFKNIVAVLAEAGAEPQNLVRLTWYVRDIDEYKAAMKDLGSAYREVFGKTFPAMALVQVAGLVEDEARLEIEATAVIPDA